MSIAVMRTGQPLDAQDFVCLASGGFGDPQNNRAHAMVWFQGRLYVGITRHQESTETLPVSQRRSIRAGVGHRDHYSGQRGQLWRYDPYSQDWDRVLVSPELRMSDGSTVPREVGYRRMVVFQSASDAGPALYVSTISTLGSLILRSEDGENFAPLSGAGIEDLNTWSFRALVGFNGRLYASPTGSIDTELIERNRVDNPIVFENREPVTAPWKAVSEPGFGDPTNGSICEMAALDGFLYAGTFNPYMGFQIWKTPAEGHPDRWKRVITAGAFRGKGNQGAVSMVGFRGALYVGSGIQGLGADKAHNTGQAAAELVRVYPDDTWELIVGEPRVTFDGSKSPLSGLGPGFDNRYNSVIWQMAEHDGWLYAGTHDWCSLLACLRPLRNGGQRRLWGRALDALIAREGGFDLWRSRNGTHWEPVTTIGFGNPNNYGLRTMASTPVGLFIGTAMVPQSIAGRQVRGDSDPTNLQGGCEIWLGYRG